MAQTKASPASPAKSSPRAPQRAAQKTDHARDQALSRYGAALRLMQEGKYEKARVSFEKMLADGAGDLTERIRMYLQACGAQTARRHSAFPSNEERYDYAVLLLNEGNYADAREQFRSVLKQDGGADYAHYGLAALSSLTGDLSGCLAHLAEAIRRRPQYRLQARSDPDFQGVADDPRFTELLYPEA